MGNFKDSVGAILGRLETEWPLVGNGSVPIAYPNDKFQQPDGPWIRITIRFGTKQLIGLGIKRRWRTAGVIIVNVFDKIDVGSGNAEDLATDIEQIFQGQSFGGVIAEATDINHIGPDGEWYQVNASTPFRADSFDP